MPSGVRAYFHVPVSSNKFYNYQKMTKTIYLFTVFVLLSVSSLQGQTPRSMTIEELFRLADTQNSDIGAAGQAVDVARQQEKIARTARLPQISASLTLSYLGDGTILDRDFPTPCATSCRISVIRWVWRFISPSTRAALFRGRFPCRSRRPHWRLSGLMPRRTPCE